MTDNKTEHKEKDIDILSGVETTGHEWDGLKELNNPLPRWWVWIFVITVIWSVWYFVVYPAWPTPGGATLGTSGYTQHEELKQSQAEIFERQSAYADRFSNASFEEIFNDPALYGFAMAGGRAMFKNNCATCHGTGAAGGKGYPNLNDDDWLWGGTVEDIYITLLHGIRVAGDYDTRQSLMPAFGKEGTLKRDEIKDTVDYVLALSNKTATEEMKGHKIFQQNCASCHGTDGRGMHKFGSPNLTDAIWLYGGERDDIYHTIYYSRAGMMPAWKDRLDDNTLRQLSVYVHQLGGGEETLAQASTEQKVAPTRNPEEGLPQIEETPDSAIVESIKELEDGQ